MATRTHYAKDRTFSEGETTLIRIAKAVQNADRYLWDFAREYAALNQQPGFNYQALCRAAKEQHSIDLVPPYTASKLRKAYEAFCLDGGVTFDIVTKYSPHYLYEISRLTPINKSNAMDWLRRAGATPRQDLLPQLKAVDDLEREPTVRLTIPESVFLNLDQARMHLGRSVGRTNLSVSVFMEFVTELIANTDGSLLRRLWDKMHGEDEYEPDYAAAMTIPHPDAHAYERA